MSNDYLWDGSGEPDPELQHLEKSLAQFRHTGKAPAFPAIDFSNSGALQHKRSLFAFLARTWTFRYAAVAVLAATVLAVGVLLRWTPAPESSASGWNVVRVAGVPRLGHLSLTGDSNKAQLKVGQIVVTDEHSRASLSSTDFGEVDVDPGSRVRLLAAGSNLQRIALDVGTIHAAIWAAPGEFQVDTPAASAIDLGCAYTLHVEPDGSGTIRTTLGWVGFHRDGRDSFIPAGAVASTDPVRGPGTPYFEDAPQALREALHQFDSAAGSTAAREDALRTVLAEARPRDAFTLWHLLSRVDGSDRASVYDRLASLLPPPGGITRDSTLALAPHTLDAWWNAFDLGDISVWRFWEQNRAPELKSSGTYDNSAR